MHAQHKHNPIIHHQPTLLSSLLVSEKEKSQQAQASCDQKRHILGDNSLNAIQPHAQHVHSWAVRETHKVVARAVEQIATSRGVQIKEDAGNDNDLFFQTGLEEVEAVGDAFGESIEIEPPGWVCYFPNSESRQGGLK
jgi:hypothetical protein